MNYPGSKNAEGVFQFLINQIPPHRCYIEGFLGSGAIIRNKQPAELNIGIEPDLDALDLAISAFESWPPKVLYSFTCGEFQDVIDQIDKLPFNPDEIMIYLDPPYLFETRKSPDPLFKFEMGTAEEHQQLLDLIKDRPEKIMISGYFSELYAEQLAHWRVKSFNAMTNGGLAREYIWMNYPEPTRLHEYTYLGRNSQERQRIKRKINRHIARLERLPTLERAAILAALMEADPISDPAPTGSASNQQTP